MPLGCLGAAELEVRRKTKKAPWEWKIVARNFGRGQRISWVGGGDFAKIEKRLEQWPKNTWKSGMAATTSRGHECRWIRLCMTFGMAHRRNPSHSHLQFCGSKKSMAALRFIWRISRKLMSTSSGVKKSTPEKCKVRAPRIRNSTRDSIRFSTNRRRNRENPFSGGRRSESVRF